MKKPNPPIRVGTRVRVTNRIGKILHYRPTYSGKGNYLYYVEVSEKLTSPIDMQVTRQVCLKPPFPFRKWLFSDEFEILNTEWGNDFAKS